MLRNSQTQELVETTFEQKLYFDECFLDGIRRACEDLLLFGVCAVDTATIQDAGASAFLSVARGMVEQGLGDELLAVAKRNQRMIVHRPEDIVLDYKRAHHVPDTNALVFELNSVDADGNIGGMFHSAVQLYSFVSGVSECAYDAWERLSRSELVVQARHGPSVGGAMAEGMVFCDAESHGIAQASDEAATMGQLSLLKRIQAETRKLNDAQLRPFGAPPASAPKKEPTDITVIPPQQEVANSAARPNAPPLDSLARLFAYSDESVCQLLNDHSSTAVASAARIASRRAAVGHIRRLLDRILLCIFARVAGTKNILQLEPEAAEPVQRSVDDVVKLVGAGLIDRDEARSLVNEIYKTEL